jgi:endonuclease/exonuclease/phosphatase family metal-dependent hydrolase
VYIEGLDSYYRPFCFYLLPQFGFIETEVCLLKPQNKTLLTLNVGQFSNDTSKVSSVVKMIREVRPDVIALQEFGLYHKWPDVNSMSQEFAKRINCTYYHFDPHAGNIFGTAVFSKYPILHSDLIFNEPSQTNEGWRFLIAFPSDTLNLINVHLESFNFQSKNRLPIDEVMSKQLIQIRSVLSNYDSRSSTVFCGDFNNIAGSKVYTLIDQSFNDAALEKGVGWLPTLKTPPFRIDHIFYNQSIGVNSIELYMDAPSDHAALLVDFN